MTNRVTLLDLSASAAEDNEFMLGRSLVRLSVNLCIRFDDFLHKAISELYLYMKLKKCSMQIFEKLLFSLFAPLG